MAAGRPRRQIQAPALTGLLRLFAIVAGFVLLRSYLITGVGLFLVLTPLSIFWAGIIARNMGVFGRIAWRWKTAVALIVAISLLVVGVQTLR